MIPTGPTVLQACADPALFAKWFRDGASWRAWFTFLKVLFGLPLGEAELATFRSCTGRDEPPPGGVREAWLVCGRRSGKSFALALVAVFLAAFVEWGPFLAPGERGTIMVVAADRRQARTIFRYIRALLKIPLLAELIERETADALDLSNSITIEIQTASWRSTRGYTLIAALCDELAFWRSDESANPDSEIISAIRPAMATVPGAMLLCASSPYARRGALWDAYRRHYGKPGAVLVWKADTRTMNPTVPQSVIDDAIEADPSSAAAEYGAEFRVDVETYIAREVVEAAVAAGRHELPRVEDIHYIAFVDPSGGSADSMTLAIAHSEGERVVLDVVRERRPPFSPDDVAREFAETLKAYGVTSVRGDRYGGLWPRERLQVHGVEYMPAEQAEVGPLPRPASDLELWPRGTTRQRAPHCSTLSARTPHGARWTRLDRPSARRAR